MGPAKPVSGHGFSGSEGTDAKKLRGQVPRRPAQHWGQGVRLSALLSDCTAALIHLSEYLILPIYPGGQYIVMVQGSKGIK